MSTTLTVKIGDKEYSFSLDEAEQLYDKLKQVFGENVPNSVPVQPYNPWVPYGPVKMPNEIPPCYPWWEYRPQDSPTYYPQIVCSTPDTYPPTNVKSA